MLKYVKQFSSVQAEALKEYQLSVKVYSLKAFTFMFSKLNFTYWQQMN